MAVDTPVEQTTEPNISPPGQPPMDLKKSLNMLQLVLLGIGFFGIQHGFSIQFAKMSAIYEKLGAVPDQIPILWLAAPLTGLLVNPTIGFISDRTWTPLGRRRPFFLLGAILATIALFLMPSASAIWMAAGLLWILDASINISMEPYRAFVADKLPKAQLATGYAIQTLMIGLGGALGFIIAGKDWVKDIPALTQFVPDSMHAQFYICGLVYLASVVITVITTPEEPPKDMAAFKAQNNGGLSISSWFNELSGSLKNMPGPMKRLAFVQFFTWMGLFSMWMFYSVAVAHFVFHANDPHSALYDQGVAAASNSMTWYQYVSMGFALLIPLLAKKISKVTIHTIGLTCAGTGLLSVWFIQDPNLLVLPMIGVGIGWATILSMPYAILVNHIPKEKYGTFMGLFNMFIVIPEIIFALGLGKMIVQLANNNQMMVVALGGVFMLTAAILVQGLRKFEEPKPQPA